MKSTTHLRSLVIAFSLAFCACSLRAAETWVTLFNGKDLTGWEKVHDVMVEVNEGNLRIVKGMGWLRTAREYGDCIFEAEWRALSDKYDSGLFFRCVLEGKPWPKDGWQVNLRQDRLGGLVKGYANIVPAEAERVPVNQWVKFRLEIRGTQCALFVNGEKSWEYDKIDRERGYLGIQIEDKTFDFRNIRVQELAPAGQ